MAAVLAALLPAMVQRAGPRLIPWLVALVVTTATAVTLFGQAWLAPLGPGGRSFPLLVLAPAGLGLPVVAAWRVAAWPVPSATRYLLTLTLLLPLAAALASLAYLALAGDP